MTREQLVNRLGNLRGIALAVVALVLLIAWLFRQ